MDQAGSGDSGIYGGGPAILLFADSGYAAGMAEDAVLAAGARTAASHGIDGAAEWLDARPGCDAVIVEVGGDPGAPFDRLLERLNLAAAEGRYRSVVSIPPALIDAAAAHAAHEDVQILCGAGPIERGAALALALSPAKGAGVVREPAERMQLRRLSEEAARIAAQLALLANAPAPEHRAIDAGAVVADRITPPTATAVRAMIKARRLRDHYFAAELFADPAWDILLDLLAARIEGKTVAVSSLCIAAAVPPTTALRWIKLMTEQQLIVRIADERDGRRVYIELSDGATVGLSAYFGALAKIGVQIK